MTKEDFTNLLNGRKLYWAYGDMGKQSEWCYIWSDIDDTPLDCAAPEWLRDFMYDNFGAFEEAEHAFSFDDRNKNKDFRKLAIHEE